MTDDLHTKIRAELPAQSMLRIDIDSVIVQARKENRNRRWLIGGAGTAGVAVLAGALMAASMAGFGTADESRPGPADDGSPSTLTYNADVPELDPDTDYMWSLGEVGDPTQTSEAYTDAFLTGFQAAFPDAEPDLHMYSLEGSPVATDSETAFFPVPEELYEAPEGQEVIFTRDSLSLNFVAHDGGATTQRAPAFQFGDDMPNYIGARVLPKGSFTPDSDDVYDPAQCSSWEDGAEKGDCSVDTVKGPSGEDIRQLTTTVQNTETGRTTDMSNCTVVYRTSGDAVIVYNEIQGWNGGTDGDEDGFEDVTPSLTLDDLTELALALPDTPIA